MISVTIIAKNAGLTLDKCLSSVQNISDDIVVVIDQSSSDDTAKIAAKYKTKNFYREFDNFASQKNFAISKTKHAWIFSLDADEYSSAALNSEMINAVSNPQFAGYKIPRLNIIFGKPIYHSNWGPSDDTHLWLFNKKFCRWQGSVHEEVVCDKEIGLLTNYKIHENYRTVEEFITKMNSYTTKEAKDSRMYTNPCYDFFRRYFWHFGFLDGWHGLFLSYLMVIYHLTIWVKKSCSIS